MIEFKPPIMVKSLLKSVFRMLSVAIMQQKNRNLYIAQKNTKRWQFDKNIVIIAFGYLCFPDFTMQSV